VNLDKENQKLLALWAADCAEHVLPYFEEEYPKDTRPRKAVEAARAWTGNKITVGEARDASQTAAREAARAAGHAAATAHVDDHAPHAATYSVKAATAVAPTDIDTATAEELIGNSDAFRSTFDQSYFPTKTMAEGGVERRQD